MAFPGMTIMPRAGAPDPGTDNRFGGDLWLRSPARTMLESLASKGDRYLSRSEVEDWISQIVTTQGEAAINRVRDDARRIAPSLGRKRAYRALDRIIAAALTTGDATTLVTPDLRARAAGMAVDARRIRLFRELVTTLTTLAPAPLPALPTDESRRRLLPFYEAYFSNFIEGTEFTIDEAAGIIFDRTIPPGRPADAHDILGTYGIVADDAEMSTTPNTPDRLVELLCRRHAIVLEGRPESEPGVFKSRPNQAGSTLFVMPDAVEGTLRAGFELAEALIDPFARATYLMFLVSEVHPFADGNGRVARIMTNAELVRGGEVRTIVPTVYRNNYLAALKAATNNGTFEPLIAVLRFAQRYTARIDFSSRDTAERDLTSTNAFRDPNEADDYGIRLQMPGT